MENNDTQNNQQEQQNANVENVQTTQQTEPLQAKPYNAQKEVLPNSTGALVLGIISIVTCWCYGIIGLTLGIIGLIISNKGKRLYEENPELYTEGSYKNLNAGRIMSIIGLAISAAYIIFLIIYIIFIVGTVSGLSHSYDFYNF